MCNWIGGLKKGGGWEVKVGGGVGVWRIGDGRSGELGSGKVGAGRVGVGGLE